jgi:hypothetical protein
MLIINKMETFSHEVIKETENAVFAKVPYYEETNEYKKSHKQKFYECWIPKIVITSGNAKSFVFNKMNQTRLSNSYQKRQNAPSSWNTIGTYAPLKVKQMIDIIDEEKFQEIVKSFEEKYGSPLLKLLHVAKGSKGEVSEEDYQVIEGLTSRKKDHVPFKKEVRYL